MSTLTKEQVLKFAAAWQAMIVLVTWYVNTIGIDSLNRLLFGLALVIALVILFLKKDNTEKVAVAVGTIDRFLKSQSETEKAKEVSDEEYNTNPALGFLLKMISDLIKSESESEAKTEVDIGVVGHVAKDLGSATDE